MTIPLPQSIPTTTQWQLMDRRYITRSSPPAAGGIASVVFPPLDSAEMWLIDRAVASCDSSTPTKLRLYDGAAEVVRLLSGSDRGAYDEADYPGGLLLEPTSQVLAEWSDASAGAVGTIRLQVQVYRRVVS